MRRVDRHLRRHGQHREVVPPGNLTRPITRKSPIANRQSQIAAVPGGSDGAARVAIALGTDRYQSTDATEANSLLRTSVFSNIELLKAWTETTAATIFPDRRIRWLAEGYEASFLVLAGNPLDDFANTGRIVLRVKQGHLLR